MLGGTKGWRSPVPPGWHQKFPDGLGRSSVDQSVRIVSPAQFAAALDDGVARQQPE